MLALLTQSSVRLSLALAVTALAVVPRADAQNGTTIDSRLYEGLTWRNLGPFRAGRVAAVSGPIEQPVVFYIGRAPRACGRRDAIEIVTRDTASAEYAEKVRTILRLG